MKQEAVDSAASYSVAGAALLVSLAQHAQSLTIIIALLIALIRLVYDGVRLYRYLKGNKHE